MSRVTIVDVNSGDVLDEGEANYDVLSRLELGDEFTFKAKTYQIRGINESLPSGNFVFKVRSGHPDKIGV